MLSLFSLLLVCMDVMRRSLERFGVGAREMRDELPISTARYPKTRARESREIQRRSRATNLIHGTSQCCASFRYISLHTVCLPVAVYFTPVANGGFRSALFLVVATAADKRQTNETQRQEIVAQGLDVSFALLMTL